MSCIVAVMRVLVSLGAVSLAASTLEENTESCDSELTARAPVDMGKPRSSLIQRDLAKRDSLAEVLLHEPVKTQQSGSSKKVDKEAAPGNDKVESEDKKSDKKAKGESKEDKNDDDLPKFMNHKVESEDKKSDKKSDKKAKGESKSKEDKDDDDDLPAELRLLGLQLFGTEDNLNKVISNSTVVKTSVFDIPLRLRIKTGDNAVERLPDEGKTDEYGVNKIMDEGPTVHGMINVVDMGANYGIVPIALFHKYPKLVRAVIAELVPTTYFFLRWNLLLNNVPLLTEKELAMKGKDRTPGVLALNKGVAEKDKTEMHVCWSPDNSMNAMICDCTKKPFPSECLTVQTISTSSMLEFFGKDGIDFLKMDCEGCELHSLPALDAMDGAPKLVRRLVGELHEVPPSIEDIACKFNHKTWMTKVCRNRGAGQQLECNPETRDKKCYVPVPWPRP